MTDFISSVPFMLLRVAALLLLAFAGFCLLLYWRQEALLFLPEQAPLESVRREAQAVGFRLWPVESADYRALLAEPSVPAVGTCVIWHGNAGSARQRDYLAAPLLALGWRVVVAEYPGYGARPPGSLREAALVAEARSLAEEVRGRFGDPLVVVGESLGAALAAAVAGDPGLSVQGVLLLTPWQDLAGVARHHYPWLPVGLLLRDRFDNAAALRDYRGPVLIATAGGDEIVPATQGERLYAQLATVHKRLHEIAGAGHNDWLDRLIGDTWLEWLLFVAGSAYPCTPTYPDMDGPFYRPGAPVRSQIGTGYLLMGEVKSALDCQPVGGARIELWMTGPDGHYDDRWRATTFARDDGRYFFRGHVPAPYGSRPPHIHLIVNAPGFRELITQHYPQAGHGEALFDLVLIPTR
jgi:hypothetical protein